MGGGGGCRDAMHEAEQEMMEAISDGGAAGMVNLKGQLQVSSLGGIKSSLGDVKSSLGDAESSLGDARCLPHATQVEKRPHGVRRHEGGESEAQYVHDEPHYRHAGGCRAGEEMEGT